MEMPGPTKIGYELLHYKYIAEVSDLYRIPLNDDERGFIEGWYAREPAAGSPVRRMLSSVVPALLGGPETFYIGFKTFPQFHRYNEFFDRTDIKFIVLHRENLDMAFLSWCVALYRDNFGDTFNAKLEGLRFAKIAERAQGLQLMMQNFLFNLRVMSHLLERGAIHLRVDEHERVQNSPKLDEYFGRAIDFSPIDHRSDYSALPDMDLFQEHFRQLLDYWGTRSERPSRLVEAFEARPKAPPTA
jgi:hypothetical protein